MMTTFGIRTRTRIAQWNVRTLREASRQAQLEVQMANYNIDILGVSEMRWNGRGESTPAYGSTILHSGKDDRGESGVGLIISTKMRNTLHSWKPISDRIILARFCSNAHRHVSIVQCYAPTEDADCAAKDEFYAQLTATLSSVRRGDITFLMGDFNAKIGNNNSGLKQIMGTHGCGSRNNNGSRLIDVCQTFQLVIGGSIFPHKEIHKYTWTSPSGTTRNQIDHICVSRKWRGSLLDVRNRRGADIDTDHELITGDVKIKLKCRKKNYTPRRHKRLNVQLLRDPETKKATTSAFREKLLTNNNNTDWEATNAKLRQIAQEKLGTIKTTNIKPWISDTTWGIIQRRNELKRQLISDGSLRSAYREVAKQVKKSARNDKRKFVEDLASDAEAAAGVNNMRQLYRIVGRLTNQQSNSNQPIRDLNGALLTSNDDQIRRWKEHFEATSNIASSSTPSFEVGSTTTSNKITTSCPSLAEIKDAIKKLKLNKAAGEDGIQPELMIADPQISAEILHPHITAAWSNEKLSPSWTKGIIVKLPKKGDLRDCGNWRGITLLNTIYKIVAAIIQSRLKDIERSLRDEQAGFRPHRSCVDQANTLRIIVEQSVEWRSPLYMLFVDFKKAFDTIKRDAIWLALSRKGVPAKIIRLIKALYENSELAVLHKGNISDPFTTNAGVRQGCPLSPLLFAIVLDDVMSQLTLHKKGIVWSFTRHLEDLDFADDVCLLSHKLSDMQAKADRLVTLARIVGLEVNIAKTKAMRVNHNNARQILVDGCPVEFVESFCYLGCIITADGGADEDVNCRLNKARSAFGRMHTVWGSSQISRRIKLRIFSACVKSVLLYGSETWLVSNTITQRLQSFINKCLRIICRIFWPNTISNDALWRLVNEEPILRQIKRRKWRWIGHTLRKSPDSITRMALDWNPQGSRGRGRPKNTWRRSMLRELADADITWDGAKTTAQNRVRWKSLVEALCSREE